MTLIKNLKGHVRNLLVKGVPENIKRYYRGAATILMYHRITSVRYREDFFDPNYVLAVHVEEFDKQLAYLTKNYNCLSIEEFYTNFMAGTLPERAVVVTFDDGYLDNLELAVPVLEKYKVPAVIYVTTGPLDNIEGVFWWFDIARRVRLSKSLSFDWKGTSYNFDLDGVDKKYQVYDTLNAMMKGLPGPERRELSKIFIANMPEKAEGEAKLLTWDKLRELAASPMITIGAHTITHQNLRMCQESEAFEEMSVCKNRLEEMLGIPVDHFSYPYGEVDHAITGEFRIAKSIGYKTACTTLCGHVQLEHTQYLTRLPRIFIGYNDDLPIIEWKLSGLYAIRAQHGVRVVL